MFFLLLLSVLLRANALPDGAPTRVCESMMPSHGGGILPQADRSPFGVMPRRERGAVIVTLRSPFGIPFEGFMLQARTPSRELLGVFRPDIAVSHTIDCAEPGDTLTHNQAAKKDSVQVTWTPPTGYEGPVIFNATIAQSYSTFWVGVESPPVEISKRSIDDPLPVPDHRPPSTTTPFYRPEPPREAAAEFDPFYTGCASSKLCFGAPDGCVISRSCKAAVAVLVTGETYVYEMKATSGAAWVGVGLSDDDRMGDDSVVECVKKNNNAVGAFMSWTSGSPNYGATRLPNPYLGIRLLNGSVVDDTLYCRVQRDVRTSINGKLFDLANNKYNLLIASGTGFKQNGVGFHDLVFLASGEKQALSDVSSLAGASKILIRLHGSFMLAAWIGAASLGILLARYYKQTWVGSSLCGKDLWFAWHRSLMVLTWTLTIVAFVLIFVELKGWSGENSTHAILGTITTVICFFQPIGAYFRPHPGTPKRAIFNWLHWLGGNVAHILAIVTIFLAVRLTKAELPEFVDWILVAFVAFHVVIHLLLSIMNCISEKSSDRRVTSFPMKDLGGSGRSSAYTDRNPDAPQSGFRKCILALYIVIILALVIALIVITALAPIEESWNSLKTSMTAK